MAAQGTTLTFIENYVPRGYVVSPGLGPEQTEQVWREVEHGDTGVEHLVDCINELLGLRVHYFVQHPQALPKHDIGDGCRGSKVEESLPTRPSESLCSQETIPPNT